MLPNFAYVHPESVKAALKQLETQGARLHAGGTDLLGCLRDGIFDAKKVVSISGLNALKGVREISDGGLRIGALTTITEVEQHPAIRNRFRALSQGAGEVASPQLRNQGTIGGNICQKPRCWYYRGEFHCLRKGGDRCYAVDGENQYHCIFGGENCFIVHPSDAAPPLVALEAVVRIVGPQGIRSVPVARFHVPPSENFQKETVLAPGEVVTEIVLPPAPSRLRSSYRKVRARRAWDFALAGMALAITLKEDTVQKARVVFSGVAPVPWRSVAVEEVITGGRLDRKTVAKAADAAVQEAEPLEKNGYKVPLLRGVVAEELLAAGDGGTT